MFNLHCVFIGFIDIPKNLNNVFMFVESWRTISLHLIDTYTCFVSINTSLQIIVLVKQTLHKKKKSFSGLALTIRLLCVRDIGIKYWDRMYFMNRISQKCGLFSFWNNRFICHPLMRVRRRVRGMGINHNYRKSITGYSISAVKISPIFIFQYHTE